MWWRTRLGLARRQDYQRDYEEYIVDSSGRNKLIVALVREACRRGKYIIVLVERVKHLKDLSSRLSEIPHKLVFGERDVSDRIDSKSRFEAGKIRVLIVNKVFKKGVDIKRVDVIIDGAAMKSRNDCVQKYGRGVRMCEKKMGLLYFDIGDLGNRFEKAAKGRINSLKKIGVPVFKIDSSKGVKRIFDLAEAKLKKELAA